MQVRCKVAASAIAFSVLVGGCSTHPLPDDVTRKSTTQIVQKIRCEAREGLLRIPRDSYSSKELEKTFVGFDFTFDVTEINKATSGLLEFTNLFSSSKFTLALKGGADKKRQNLRFFRLINSMQELLDEKSCIETKQHANYIYPIGGRIGLDEVVQTYWSLNQLSRFQQKAAKDTTIFSDTLTFTTTLDAGIKPELTVNAVAGRLKLTKATIDGSVQRKDIHKVAIAISTATSGAAVARSLSLVSPYTRDLSIAAAPGVFSGAAGVILELNRLRREDEDARALEKLRLLE